MLHRLLLLLALPMIHASALNAQSLDTQTGWAAWSSSYKLTDRWTLASDAHLRSTDDWNELRTVILRPGANYALRPNLSLGVGYAYVRTNAQGAPDAVEHRLWQQLIANQRIGAKTLTHRVRLEQRDIEQPTPGAGIDANRLRYFVRTTLPLRRGEGGTAAGSTYLALQNEAFFNLDRKERLNGQTFDQSRTFVGFGWRLRSDLDLEVGYLHQFVNGRTLDTRNHAVMTSLVTRF